MDPAGRRREQYTQCTWSFAGLSGGLVETETAYTTCSHHILVSHLPNLRSALELPTAQQVQTLPADLAALQAWLQASREFTQNRTPDAATIGTSQITSQLKAACE